MLHDWAKRTYFQTTWRRNGTAKVSRFLSPAELAELHSAVEASYALLAQHVDDNPPTLPPDLTDHFRRWEGIWVKVLRDYLKEAGPHVLAELDRALEAAQARFRSLFDDNWWLDTNFTFIRRHRSTKKYLPWHIDADAANTASSADECVNTWLPLDPVGKTAPSLELIPGSNKVMRNLPLQEGPNRARSDDWVKENIRAGSWVPRANPGDAILFDHWTLHRTQRLAQENVLRTSCEFRFVTARQS